MPSFLTPHSAHSERLSEVGWTDEARVSSLEKRRARQKEKAAEIAANPLKFAVPSRVRKIFTDAAITGKPIPKDAVLKALPEDAVKKLQAHIEKGREALPEFESLMSEVAKDFELPDASFDEFEQVKKDRMAIVGPLKSIERSAEKVVNDYDGDLPRLGDIVRGSVVVRTPEEARAVLKSFQEKATITNLKNRLETPLDSGYRDVNFRVKLSNGMPGEVQIHVAPVLKAKNRVGHRLYEKIRTTFPGTVLYDRAMRASQNLYNKAWMISLAGVAAASSLPHKH